MSRFPFFALVASAVLSTLALAAPALARPELGDQGLARPEARDQDPDRSPRADGEADLPTDGRPIVAMVVAIDGDNGRVMLSTPHGPVALSVSQEVVDRLKIGDVVVVQFTGEDDYPSASPPTEEPTSTERLRI
jgi:hypothetical protein